MSDLYKSNLKLKHHRQTCDFMIKEPSPSSKRSGLTQTKNWLIPARGLTQPEGRDQPV